MGLIPRNIRNIHGDLEPEYKAPKVSSPVDRLVMGDFLGDGDKEFRSFIEQMPDKHLSKYDLSAVRLGWEARKLLNENKPNSDMQQRVDNLAKLILKANRKQIRESLMPDELEYFDDKYGI